MKITKRQNQEIDFLCRHMGTSFTPTEDEKKEYVMKTVHGVGNRLNLGLSENTENRIEIAKRVLDISIKMWTEDMQKGLLSHWELTDGFDNHPYAIRIVNRIRKSLIPFPSYDGLYDIAEIAYLNSKFCL